MAPNYQNGKIYKIVNTENDIVYIGSTTQEYLFNRMTGHRQRARSLQRTCPLYTAMMQIGVEKFFIELIKLRPCDSRDELEAAEGRQMLRYQKRGIELYNATVDGEVSKETKEKMSKAQIGKKHSEASKTKMSKQRTGSRNPKFKRGCVRFHKGNSCWVFQWNENGKHKGRSFSISIHGESGAKRKAIAVQDSIYPQ